MTPTQKLNVQQWLAALESNNYRHTKAQLSVEFNDYKNGFCCLGVLCEINKLPHLIDKGYIFPDGYINNAMPSSTWFQETTGLNLDTANDLADINDANETFDCVIEEIKTILANV